MIKQLCILLVVLPFSFAKAQLPAPDFSGNSDLEVQLGLLYNQGEWTGKQNPLNQYRLSAMFGGFSNFSRHFGTGAMIGTHFTHAYFSQDSSMRVRENRVLERYTYLTLTPAFNFRLSLFDQWSNTGKGPFIDVGILYNFPVLFRHVEVYPGEKIMHRNIHQFKDFRLTAKVGWYPVSIFVEYNLKEFVLGNYPELPRWSAGICLILQPE